MKLITQILHKHTTELGQDYEAYHNHAQRVYYYGITFLLMRENTKLAIAAAFHDLDIWTGKSMDYIPGSVTLARRYLESSDFGILADEVGFIIKKHHKLRPIKGNIEAEAFRKADLTDLSRGHIRYNLPESIISETERKYPRLGFTKLIIKKSLGYACLNPSRPFPMIKW